MAQAHASPPHHDDVVTVECPYGSITGQRVGGVARFAGIQYGQASGAQHRWALASPFLPTGPLTAFDFGQRAPQPESWLTVRGEPEGDECLNLNIWTPGCDTAGRAVMVWIHGGSFTTGSSAMSWYDGAALARRGVVLVSVNYRLGALGFLNLAEFGERYAHSANLGLADQQLALRWVQRNIEAFGGDPSNVTIFGESAGAMSVGAHFGCEASTSLFSKAICQSGAARHAQRSETSQAIAAHVLANLGVSHPDEARDTPSEAVIAATGEIDQFVRRQGMELPLPFQPTIGEGVLDLEPIKGVQGRGATKPLICGSNRDEMRLFAVANLQATLSEDQLLRRVGYSCDHWNIERERLSIDHLGSLYPPRFDGTHFDRWMDIASDTVFRMPAIEMAQAHADVGGATWMYRFDVESGSFSGRLGAAHALEIPFIFDCLDASGVEMLLGAMTPAHHRLAHDLADCWTRFASMGDPGDIDSTVWPQYGMERSTLVLNCDPPDQVVAEVCPDPDAAARSWWFQESAHA